MAYKPQVLAVVDGGTGLSSTTANQILFSSAANTISQIAAGANGVLITSAGNVPSISSTLPSAVQGNITATGTISSGTWNGTAVDVAHGGTGNTTFTAYSVICAGTTATGVFQNVSGVGSAAQVLTSNGAGQLPTWQSSSSGWVKINTASAAGSAEITFTGLSSTYAAYVVIISNLAPSSDIRTFRLRTSTDNGLNYDSGASDYGWELDSTNYAASPTFNSVGDSADSFISISQTITMGNNTNENGAFNVTIFNPSAAQFCRVTYSGLYRTSGAAELKLYGAGTRLAAADVTAIQFTFDSGNIATGEFTLYGLTA